MLLLRDRCRAVTLLLSAGGPFLGNARRPSLFGIWVFVCQDQKARNTRELSDESTINSKQSQELIRRNPKFKLNKHEYIIYIRFEGAITESAYVDKKEK